jgi:hypothetical protein
MKISLKELIEMGANKDVNEFLVCIVPNGQDANYIEYLGYKKVFFGDRVYLTMLIKADGDMEDVLETIGIPLVDCTDTSITISDGVDKAIVSGKAYPSRFVEGEFELVLDFNDIILEKNILWQRCPHCEFDVPLKNSLEIQSCPNCNEVIKLLFWIYPDK